MTLLTMNVKENIKKIASYLFHLPLGMAVIIGFSIIFFILALRQGYFEVRYHFYSDVVPTIMFWVIFISSALLINWGIKKYGEKRNKDK
jgi:hypothetical protein